MKSANLSLIGRVIVAAAVFCAAPQPAQAAQTVWHSADYAQVRMINGAEKSALEVRMSPDWHAYWRMPGEGGLPPRFDWTGSENLREAVIHWPVPERYHDADMYSFGYSDQFILPISFVAEDDKAAIQGKLALALMVCNKICVPQNFEIDFTVPAEKTAAPAHDGRIAAAKLPVGEQTDDLRIENMVIGPEAIVAHIYAARGFTRGFDVFVESGDLYVTAPPEITADADDEHKAMIRIAAPWGVENLVDALAGVPVILTVTDGDQVIERRFDFD